jgi:hypothetical protein
VEATNATNAKYRGILDAQEAQTRDAPLASPQMPPLIVPANPAATDPAGRAPQTSPVP